MWSWIGRPRIAGSGLAQRLHASVWVNQLNVIIVRDAHVFVAAFSHSLEAFLLLRFCNTIHAITINIVILRCATAFLLLASLCNVMILLGEYRRAVLLRSPVKIVECD
jgi:hypothetical protein